MVFRNKESIRQKESENAEPLDVTSSGRLSRQPGARKAKAKASFVESHARFKSGREAEIRQRYFTYFFGVCLHE